MSRVVHFEIHASDPERAARFYRNILGWKITMWDGPMDYWMIETGPADAPGINGGLVPRRGEIDGQAVIAYVCTVESKDLDGTAAAIEEEGGMNVVPEMPIPGVGRLAYFKDTEGNIFGVLQPEESGG
ncbi:MAG: VOC family protein [Candidatus Eisenbacteria bacterium]